MRGLLTGLWLLIASTSHTVAGELYIFEHNGSVIEWFVVQDKITATYSNPRKGLREAGIRSGTKLFEGQYDGERIIGTAYAFKQGCVPAPYEVIGYQKDRRIHLDGPAPVRSGCEVTRYSATSPHARLVLTYSATHH